MHTSIADDLKKRFHAACALRGRNMSQPLALIGRLRQRGSQKSKVSHCGGRVPRHKANGAREAYPKDSPARVKSQK